jgi:hypothetical protein
MCGCFVAAERSAGERSNGAWPLGPVAATAAVVALTAVAASQEPESVARANVCIGAGVQADSGTVVGMPPVRAPDSELAGGQP